MLTLTRRVGEAIRIGNDVQLVVVAVVGQQLRLGINAPNEVPVHRSEIFERIQKERDDKT